MSERAARSTLGSLVAGLLLAVALPAAPGFSEDAGLRSLGTLAVAPESAILADAAGQRIVEVGGGLDTPLALSAFDAGSLRKVAKKEFAPYWPQFGGQGRPIVHHFDATSRLLDVLAFASQAEQQNFANPVLVRIDVKTMSVRRTTPLVTVFPPGIRILGMRARPGDRALFVAQSVAVTPFFNLDTPRVAGAFLVEVDLAGGSAVWGPAPIRGCQSIVSNETQAAIGEAGDSLFVGCTTVNLIGAPAPGLQAVAAVSTADPSAQRLYYLPGSYANGDVYFDESARRMLLVGSTVGYPAQAVWVFDIEHRVFVGQVASGDVNVNGAGIDPATGKMYIAVAEGLLVSSGRGYKVPQAVKFRIETNSGPIYALPFMSAVAVATKGPNAAFVTKVFKDSLPADTFAAGTPPSFSGLDSLTTDAPQFSTESQAFGLRIHAIGGVNGVLRNIYAAGGNYWERPGELTGIKDGDRDLYFARVQRAHLSADEASAEAIGADRDANTQSDYRTADETAPGVLPGWPYEVAGCRDFGSGTEPGRTEGAETECSLQKSSVSAASSFDRVRLPGFVSVGESSSGSTLVRAAGGGLLTETFAEARNVVIGDSIRIALIRSVSRAGAAGAKGKADGSYERVFEGVQAGDFSCGAACDHDDVLAALSEELGINVRVELPSADVVGTPGGAHGHALRDPWEHQQDVVINNQDETELQVPALRVVFVNDKALASRLIVDFAATKADATMLRVVAPPIVVVPPEPPLPPLPPAPPPPAVVPPPPPPPPAEPSIVEKVVRTIGHGWKFFVTDRPVAFARSAAMWMLLVSPVFFAARRRVLRRAGHARL